jgi:Family of unknown function (DUF6054)
MTTRSFTVSITPSEVHRVIINWDGAELLHHELKDFGDERWFATSVFEKYYMRNKSRAGLIVLCDNVAGDTEVRLVATGSGDGMFFKFDWGAGDNFIDSVATLLSHYWVRDTDRD